MADNEPIAHVLAFVQDCLIVQAARLAGLPGAPTFEGVWFPRRSQEHVAYAVAYLKEWQLGWDAPGEKKT